MRQRWYRFIMCLSFLQVRGRVQRMLVCPRSFAGCAVCESCAACCVATGSPKRSTGICTAQYICLVLSNLFAMRIAFSVWGMRSTVPKCPFNPGWFISVLVYRFSAASRLSVTHTEEISKYWHTIGLDEKIIVRCLSSCLFVCLKQTLPLIINYLELRCREIMNSTFYIKIVTLEYNSCLWSVCNC